MKKLFLTTLLMISAFCFSAFAQSTERYGSGNLNRYATELKRQTVDLADRTNNTVTRGNSVSRSDMEEAFLASQIDASAGLFQQLIGGNRSASELRDAASFLSDAVRRAPSAGSNSYLWRNVQNSLNDINRELGSGGNGGGYPGNGGGGYPGNGGGNGGGYPGNGGGGGNGPVIGRAYWRGTVDDKVQLTIRSQDLQIRTLSGREYTDGNFSFTSPLPNRRVYVDVNKQKGRGSVSVVQQPSRENNFTTVIEIFDDGGGAKEYQLEIYWK